MVIPTLLENLKQLVPTGSTVLDIGVLERHVGKSGYIIAPAVSAIPS